MKVWKFSCAFALVLGLAFAVPAQAETVLRWSSQGDALTLDPHSQNEGPTVTMSLQMYEALVGRDSSMKKQPALATSWSPTDSNTWQFKLRQGVAFHDGTPFTAADVVFSFQRAASESSDFKPNTKGIVSVEAVDDYTIDIVLEKPNPLLPDQITNVFIMSKAWAEANNVVTPQDYKQQEETYAIRNANGTGPFKLELREPDIRTVLVRNDGWWGLARDPHNIDRIEFRPISNKATRVAALLSGEIDFLLDPPLQDLKRIEGTSGLKTLRVNQMRTIFLGMDQGVAELRTSNVKGKNPFADLRVRQAMYQAIDIEAIREKVMRGLSIPAGFVVPPGVNGHTTERDARLPYDPAASKQLLADAGYPNGFSVRLDCPNNRYNNDERICQAVVGMFGAIGVDVDLDAIRKSLHFPKIENRETDFYLLGWGAPSTLDAQLTFLLLTHSKGEWNPTGYSNPKADALIEALPIELDLDKRNAKMAELWKIVQDDIVYLPLHHQVISWGMSDKLDVPIVPNNMPQFRWARLAN